MKKPKGYETRMDQIEAHQQEVNNERGKFYESCSEEEKSKLDAIENAIQLLTEAGVPFYGYMHAPCYATGEEDTVQFNNWGDILNPEKDIEFNEERAIKINDLHYHLVWSIIKDFGYKKFIGKSCKDTPMLTLKDLWFNTLHFFKFVLNEGLSSNKDETGS